MTDGAGSQAPVAVAGGGPVGLMLALLLDRLGVRCVLFNTGATTRWHPKGSTEGCRTMEHFRTLGLADEIRALGLPADHPTDVAYFTRFSGYELARLPMPSSKDVARARDAAAATDQTPEPIHRANQMHVERYLFEYAARRPNIVMRFGWEVTDHKEDASGVTLTAVPATGGAPERWRVQYLAGCDGGRSLVRRQAGISYQGDPGIEQRYLGGRMFSTYVRAPDLYRDVLRPRRAWQYWAINPEIRSVLISVNGNDEFLLRTQARVPDQAPDDAAVVQVMRHCAGVDTPIEIIAHEPWTAGMALVAEGFGRGRVRLAGDAVHLFTPTGGFGMNTGIDDAANLAWKLAAVVQGWGGPRLLDTYEIERKPVAIRNTGAARQLTMNIGATDVDPAIEQNTSVGEAARRSAGTMLAGFGEQFASLGVQLGARYDGSPLVAEDGAPPADDFINYTPSSVPGGRAPHVWLDGRRDYGGSLFDRLGAGFTLLRLGGKAPTATAMTAAAARANVPLKVLDVPNSDARDLYGRDLALIRPDQHVAWRGNTPAADPERLFAQATGWPQLTA